MDDRALRLCRIALKIMVYFGLFWTCLDTVGRCNGSEQDRHVFSIAQILKILSRYEECNMPPFLPQRLQRNG